jgi:hypothetical protein
MYRARDDAAVSARTWVLLATILGSSMAFVDATVVNVALPSIGRDLDRSWLVELGSR